MLISYSLSDKLNHKIPIHFFRFPKLSFSVCKKGITENLAVVEVEVKVIEVCELNIDKEVVFVLQVGTAEVSNPTSSGRFLLKENM